MTKVTSRRPSLPFVTRRKVSIPKKEVPKLPIDTMSSVVLDVDSCGAVFCSPRSPNVKAFTHKPGNSSPHAVGFMGVWDDEDKYSFNEKIETKESCKSTEILNIPSLIDEVIELRNGYSEFPLKMLLHLIVRFEGNTAQVHYYLQSKGWRSCRILQLLDNEDPHFTTLYYHGLLPDFNEANSLLKPKSIPCGTFITYYRHTSESTREYKYFLCYKNFSGSIIEKPIRMPVIPDVLRNALGLSRSIKCPPSLRKADSVPFLDRLYSNQRRRSSM